MTPRSKKLPYTLTLPFPLPTWNRVLGVNRWKRKKIRDLVKDAVSILSQYDTDSLTPMESAEKLQLMGWSYAEYYEAIGRKTLPKLLTPKGKSGLK